MCRIRETCCDSPESTRYPGRLAITVPQCDPAFIANSLAAFLRDRVLPPVINRWEHLNYFSAESLRDCWRKRASDSGRAKPAYDACMRIGEATSPEKPRS